MRKGERARNLWWRKSGPDRRPERVHLLDTDTLVRIALTALALNMVAKAAALLAPPEAPRSDTR